MRSKEMNIQMKQHINTLYLVSGDKKELLCSFCLGHKKTNARKGSWEVKETIHFKSGMKLTCARCGRIMGKVSNYHE